LAALPGIQIGFSLPARVPMTRIFQTKAAENKEMNSKTPPAIMSVKT
jgi:hypothetical protein